jgi:hypothetical protein
MITEQAIQNGLDGVEELRSIAESLERSIEAAKDLPSVCVLVDALDQVRSMLYEGRSLVAWAGQIENDQSEGGKMTTSETTKPTEQDLWGQAQAAIGLSRRSDIPPDQRQHAAAEGQAALKALGLRSLEDHACAIPAAVGDLTTGAIWTCPLCSARKRLGNSPEGYPPVWQNA